jgi:hypothetical protein
MRRGRSTLVAILVLGLFCIAGCSDISGAGPGGSQVQLTRAQIHQKMALLGRHTKELQARGILVDQYGPTGDGRIGVVLDQHTAAGSFESIRQLLGTTGLELTGNGHPATAF